MNELADFVLEQTKLPIDVWAVAATLESGGVRDLDARDRYGKRDVFDLAEAVYADCLARLDETEEPSHAAGEALPWRRRARRFARFYLHGGFFFAPLMLQIVSLVALGYGLWASLDFSVAQASVVGTALIWSFVVTGAFLQALGYLGPYFAEPGKHPLAWRATAATVALGVAALEIGRAHV